MCLVRRRPCVARAVMVVSAFFPQLIIPITIVTTTQASVHVSIGDKCASCGVPVIRVGTSQAVPTIAHDTILIARRMADAPTALGEHTSSVAFDVHSL